MTDSTEPPNPILDPLLPPQDRAAVFAPIERAGTLPQQAFTSPAILDLEKQAIFHRRWITVAFRDQIARPGSVLPISLLGAPLLLTRDQHGTLRGFHNVCPYDNCPVALWPAAGITDLTVPYHGWVYGLDGKLERAPFWKGTARLKDFADIAVPVRDLIPISTAEWADVIFVNLATPGESFQEFIAPAERLMQDVDLSRLTPMLRPDGTPVALSGKLATNWKTYTENATLNVLHEGFVHADYAASPQIPRVDADGRKCFREIIDGALLAFDFDAQYFSRTYGDHSHLPHVGRTDPPTRGAFAFLYPNLFLALQRPMLEVGWALPTDPAVTIEDRRYLAVPELATNPRHERQRLELWQMFSNAAEEDKSIVESVQRARGSPAIRHNYYSPFWDSLHHRFSQLVLRDLEMMTAE